MNKKLLIILAFSLFFNCLIYADLPNLKEARIIEQSSPREVILESTGVYHSKKLRKKLDIRKFGLSNAILDAQRSAIYFLLFQGTDPILSSDDERNRFVIFQHRVFKEENVRSLISFTSQKMQKITLNKGRGYKVIATVQVNKDALVKQLEDANIIFSKEELTTILGYPQIMVLPQTVTGKTALEVLDSDLDAKHAAGVLESYLTNKSYDVVMPSQTAQLNTMISSVLNQSNTKRDSSYELALSIGSDIYIDFSISHSKSAYDTDQYAVTIRAFETTTGRLLGSETGYSKPRKGQKQLSIEEATLSGLGNVLSRVMNYWEDDLSKGIQYKLIATIDSDKIKSQDIYDLQNNFIKIIEQYSNWSKENIITSQTMDLTLWCDSDRYSKSRLIVRDLMKDFRKNLKKYTFNITNQNRKLIIIEITK